MNEGSDLHPVGFQHRLAARRATEVFHGLLGLGFLHYGFLAHLRSMKAPMS